MDRPASIVRRRLAAIFCADVAGYTRLMNADEAGTLRLLTSHREITDRLIAQHGGRIANTAGDSILAEFPSAVDALQCALGVQERIAVVHEEVPEERRVTFRIGVHVGEVLIRDGDMFGDGVNAAARMQSLAEPGCVCLSGSAHEYVHRLMPMPFQDLGFQSVKNLDVPIRAYLARPTGTPLAKAIPPVHRSREIYLVRRLYGLLFNAIMDVVKPEGLKSGDAPILASIADAPGIDESQLAERIGIERGKTKRLVTRLKQIGIIEQIPSERALKGLRLTQAGLVLREKVRPAVIAAEDQIMSPLSAVERETLKDLMTRVIKANEAKEALRETRLKKNG